MPEIFRIDLQFFVEKTVENIAKNNLSIKILELTSEIKLLDNKSRQLFDISKQILRDNTILKDILFNILKTQVSSTIKFTCNCAKIMLDKKPADIVVIDKIGKTISKAF